MMPHKTGEPMDTLSKFTIPGILFALTLAFGFWLSNAGKPYNGILFNIHKLIALGAVVYACWQFAQALKPIDLSGILIVLLVISTLCIIALFATGGLMSAKVLDYSLMLTIHRVAPVVLALALGSMAYLLINQ
jgi:hypothetical protein